MPAWRLDENDRHVSKYDVGASDSDSEETHLVGHVLLCDIDVPTSINSSTALVQAIHMGPPLKKSPARVDIIGTAELDSGETTGGERRQIKSFIDDCLLESRAQAERRATSHPKLSPISEYIIHPVAKEPDVNYSLWRFSCAGFVMHAYLEANIELVAQEHAPEVTLDDLKRAYPSPSFRRRLDYFEFREEMGIGSGTSWPVIFAGYIAHSMNRSADEIRQAPYTPRSGDEYFPVRQDHTVEETA